MPDYDLEASTYDATRGGEQRAEAAAEAILPLLPAGTRLLVDVACGTAIVSTRLRAPGRIVVGVDARRGCWPTPGRGSTAARCAATAPGFRSARARSTR